MTDNTDALPPLPQPLVWTRYSDHGPDGAFTADQMRDYARAALAQRQQVPEGWKLVPVEPTEDMLFGAEMSAPRGYRDLYAAMLSASPQAPAQREHRNVIDQSWLDNKPKVLDAMRAAGLQLVNRGDRFEVLPCGDVQAKQEPVAWVEAEALRRVQEGVGSLLTASPDKRGFCETPLYASPQRAVEPLTDEQKLAMWKRSAADGRADYIEGIEDCERAHGITKEQP